MASVRKGSVRSPHQCKAANVVASFEPISAAQYPLPLLV